MSTTRRAGRRRPKKKKEFDINKNINIAVKTGRVYIGTKSVMRKIRFEDLPLIIVANNCPKNLLSEIRNHLSVAGSETPVYTYPFSSWELGMACGKPFMVASLGIEDPGDSEVFKLKEVKTEATA
ncbi:MAG: 50S ribosomal protein L30e [Promethearchaeota archaeon]